MVNCDMKLEQGWRYTFTYTHHVKREESRTHESMVKLEFELELLEN